LEALQRTSDQTAVGKLAETERGVESLFGQVDDSVVELKLDFNLAIFAQILGERRNQQMRPQCDGRADPQPPSRPRAHIARFILCGFDPSKDVDALRVVGGAD